jgi:hypothetical protein
MVTDYKSVSVVFLESDCADQASVFDNFYIYYIWLVSSTNVAELALGSFRMTDSR